MACIFNRIKRKSVSLLPIPHWPQHLFVLYFFSVARDNRFIHQEQLDTTPWLVGSARECYKRNLKRNELFNFLGRGGWVCVCVFFFFFFFWGGGGWCWVANAVLATHLAYISQQWHFNQLWTHLCKINMQVSWEIKGQMPMADSCIAPNIVLFHLPKPGLLTARLNVWICVLHS